MLKSCYYCGKVHPEGYDCPKKPKQIRKQYDTKQVQFRATTAWRTKRKQIQERDRYLCQACLNELPGTVYKYNSNKLSVHHIVSLDEDYSRRLDEDNLITLCAGHHSQADAGIIDKKTLFDVAKGE